MKNIHLLPTDKPSRLGYLTKKGKEVFNDLRLFEKPMPNILDSENQNIYITSNEEIKEGDWTFDGENPYKWTEDDVEDCLYNPGFENYKGSKKIILTTDQDLIKDGVQAIDDEFLEWFVKNPSCERVEVEKVPYDGTKSIDKYWGGEYKIIIPKEEPNPFELPKALPDDVFYESLEEPKQELRKVCKCKRAYINPLSGICSLCWNEKFPDEKDDIKEEDLLKPKQETLEEVAENYGWKIKTNTFSDSVKANELAESAKQDFIAGAKWQQERMYSEEEVGNIANWAFGFYKRNDLSDSELEDEFNRILVEQFKKK